MLKVIKLLRNLFVLKAGLNFRIFLRLKVHVLRAGRSSWSLFCWFCKTFLNSLSTSSWRNWFNQGLIIWAKRKKDAHSPLLYSFKKVFIRFPFSSSRTARVLSSRLIGPIWGLLFGFVASESTFQYAAVEFPESIF